MEQNTYAIESSKLHGTSGTSARSELATLITLHDLGTNGGKLQVDVIKGRGRQGKGDNDTFM